MEERLDISADSILIEYWDKIADNLLQDRATTDNIIWATNDYRKYGKGYGYYEKIPKGILTEADCPRIQPRSQKEKSTQETRSREMAEVFTPTWVCNKQNNAIDAQWFGREGVFNRVTGKHTWESTRYPIIFCEDKKWKKYVSERRMEICCGEAPYIVSRYDSESGEKIGLKDRVGLLDRKLRVVSENTDDSSEFIDYAKRAYRSIYAYEWQGDNLLLARKSMLLTFIEYYVDKFEKKPKSDSVKSIAYIISWNVWQMDGLKGVVPSSCTLEEDGSIFKDEEEKGCTGCRDNKIQRHNGIKCKLRDWNKPRGKGGRDNVIYYVDLLKA